MYAGDFQRCLAECDVAGIRRLWRHVQPNLPQPGSDFEALATIHRARTETRSLSLQLRAYSHRWLLDNGLPSGLPDDLKPAAERRYPKIAEGVGLASLIEAPYSTLLRSVQVDKVREIYAETPRRLYPDPIVVRREHLAARAKERRKLSLPREPAR